MKELARMGAAGPDPLLEMKLTLDKVENRLEKGLKLTPTEKRLLEICDESGSCLTV